MRDAHADDAAKTRRHTYRAAGIAAQRKIDQTASNRRRGATRRASRDSPGALGLIGVP
jgi:hypothetical protein